MMNANQRNAQLDSIGAAEFEDLPKGRSDLDLKDPRAVLSLLEADQVVAAKQRTHFGRRNLSLGVRTMLWGLRIYVVIMLVLVVISAVRALHSTP
jgi:hypothetical protein